MWRSLLLVAAVSLSACAYHAPATPSSATPPDLSAAASLSLGATPGFGQDGGTATVTAKVQDGHGVALAGALVTFSTDTGTLTPPSASTGSDGVATVHLASTTAAKVTATVGTLSSHIGVAAEPNSPGPGPSYTVTLSTSGSSITAGGSVTMTAFATPQNGAPAPTTYAFDCNGDGVDDLIGSANVATCRYVSSGSFTAKVTVSGGTATNFALTSVSVGTPPAATFTVSLVASPATVNAGTQTTLTASATPLNGAGTPTRYTWDCGDGSGSVPNTSTTHGCTYATAATFNAKVTVSDGSVSSTGFANVISLGPVATLTCTPTTGMVVNCQVAATLNGASVPSGNITIGAWDFGDASAVAPSGNTASHTYATVNSFQIRATGIIVPGSTAPTSASASVAVQP